MDLRRRDVMMTAVAAAALASAPEAAGKEGGAMYGLIGKMRATPGKGDDLAAYLLEGSAAMPGCLSYVVARDPSDPDGVWITEVWDSAESHKASLALPQVQAVIAKARPIIAGFSDRHETVPIGGAGLNLT